MTEEVAFVDCETTGLDPDRHEIWEVGLILPDGTEHEWQLPVDLGRADPMALSLGRFHDRRWPVAGALMYGTDSQGRQRQRCTRSGLAFWCREFVGLTRDLHLGGASVSFDADRLWRLLRANGECPMWHYHLVDVEVLAVGWVRGRHRGRHEAGVGWPLAELTAETEKLTATRPPWKSAALSRAVGVDPDDFDRHSALGDARWAKAIYEVVMDS